VARVIDGLIVGIPAAIIGTILTAAVDSWIVSGLITGVIYAAAFLGYFGFLESSRGATVGKQVMKLRVVGPGGGNPTMEQAVRRNVYYGATVLYVVPILGAFVAFVIEVVAIILIAVGINGDPRRQHWFDKFAGGTQVEKIG
jgi:uncharacterized RDD family membrane protein YckC